MQPLDGHLHALLPHREKGASQGHAAARLVAAKVPGVFFVSLQLAREGRAGKGCGVVSEEEVSLRFPFPCGDPPLQRTVEAAVSLVPERAGRETFFNPDAEQGIPVPPYAAFRGFSGVAFLAGAEKKPSTAFPRAFRVNSRPTS